MIISVVVKQAETALSLMKRSSHLYSMKSEVRAGSLTGGMGITLLFTENLRPRDIEMPCWSSVVEWDLKYTPSYCPFNETRYLPAESILVHF